ncbi:hypothetical protein ACFP9V_19820 [Deinococcus radiopugnans]|uniref:hypothetical protein n=1 Tax=Deinococcus radiopugnans TaxID=57497 RepID=UPI00360F5183
MSDYQRPIRLAMVGGGQDAFIGAVHRHAAALDGRYVLVAGALSSTPERSRASGAALGLPPSAVTAPGRNCWTANRGARTARR